MGFNTEELSEFARHYGFHYADLDPHALIKEVLIDMERGLEGLSSSLPMIPSYISPVTQIQGNKTVLALDAGGTNLRASLVSFDAHGKLSARETVKSAMPGTNGRVNALEFFDTIASAIMPLLSSVSAIDGIGFTFSYPMDIQPDADGILMAFSKEVDAPDVIGKKIGTGLRDALTRQKYTYAGPIVLLNDTVATLLSGIAAIPADGVTVESKNDFGWPGGPVIGFILGTGFNTAYPETSIPKIGFNSQGSAAQSADTPSAVTRHAPQIVVCESGMFNVRHRGQLDLEFDSTTQKPGMFALEKTVSGAYLGPLTLYILKQAVKDRLISFKKSEELLVMEKLGTRSLNEFLHEPLSSAGPIGSLFANNEADALASAQYLVSIIAERGALFSAAVLAATVERIYSGNSGQIRPYSPVRIAVEGTTYLMFQGMRRSLESWLHYMLFDKNPRPYIISPVEQASLYGAAVAAISKLQ